MFKALQLARKALPFALFATVAFAQTTHSKAAANTLAIESARIHKLTQAANSGHCTDALPALRRLVPTVTDKELKANAATAMLRCALDADDRNTALEALQVMNKDLANRPEILYLMIHAFSDLGERASMDLARTAPDSVAAHELNAESLESQGKWDQAQKEYETVLQKAPETPGIHFRLGRLLLSKPEATPAEMEQAKSDMLAELKVDPNNAGAEYVLGEMARQANDFPEAIQHFTRAAKLDANFADAYLGLGSSLLAERKFAEAIEPLEMAVKLEPGNPTAHYQLGTAYIRTGRKQDADREFALHQRLAETGGTGAAAAPSQSQ